MNENGTTEFGITPAVRTCASRITVEEIMERVIAKKTRCVLDWLGREQQPQRCLILGAYLTGSGIANSLAAHSQVTVVDIYPHLCSLLHPSVTFSARIEDCMDHDWDFVLDTTGIGGCSPGTIASIRCTGTFLVEDPAADGSDAVIRQSRRCREIVSGMDAPRKGILRTGGLRSKTSGTMTLTVDVLRHSMNTVVREEGVLYATAPMTFFERILFREKDTARFMECLARPALTVSSLREIACDSHLETILDRVHSHITCCHGGDLDESSGIFQKCGGKNPLGTVVGGRSGWFYRPG